MIGLNRHDEPEFDSQSRITAEMMNSVFEVIDQSGLTIVELKQLFGDYDAYYHGDMDRPNYIDDAKDSYLCDLAEDC